MGMAKGKTKLQLLQENSAFRLILETMQEAAFTVAPDGTVLFCNAQFGQFVDHPAGWIVGRPLREFVVPDHRADVDLLLSLGPEQPVEQLAGASWRRGHKRARPCFGPVDGPTRGSEHLRGCHAADGAGAVGRDVPTALRAAGDVASGERRKLWPPRKNSPPETRRSTPPRKKRRVWPRFPCSTRSPSSRWTSRGASSFLNPAAQRLFPDLPERGAEHPWLADWSSLAEMCRGPDVDLPGRELMVEGRWYYQTIFSRAEHSAGPLLRNGHHQAQTGGGGLARERGASEGRGGRAGGTAAVQRCPGHAAGLRGAVDAGLSRALCQPLLRGAFRQVQRPALLRVSVPPHRAVRELRNLQGAEDRRSPIAGSGPARTAATTTSTTSPSPTPTARRSSWRWASTSPSASGPSRR